MICNNSIVLINPDKFQAQQPKIGMLSRKQGYVQVITDGIKTDK
jgi:hypothetical protein